MFSDQQGPIGGTTGMFKINTKDKHLTSTVIGTKLGHKLEELLQLILWISFLYLDKM